MSNDEGMTPRRAPVCILISALLPFVLIMIAWVYDNRVHDVTAGPNVGPDFSKVGPVFAVIGVAVLAGLALAIASLRRGESLRWLAQIAVFLYLSPILAGIIFGLRFLSHRQDGNRFREEWLQQHPEQR